MWSRILLAASTLVTTVVAYTNPLWDPGMGADPWMLAANDGYYLTYTSGNHVEIRYSTSLTDFHGAEPTTVWSPTGSQGGVWAPELHNIDGRYYIYVAITDSDNAGHRMHVLQGDTQDPLKPFTYVGKLSTPDDNWAIDGTVLKYGNTNYFIWSGWTSNADQANQYLYIAKMSSPTSLEGDRVLLHSPDPSWQRSGSSGVNEGPEILVHNDRTFLVYSAAGSWTGDYCLALMGIDGGADPMVPSNWWRVDDRPVFWSSDVTFGVGHASFPFDRNGTPYIVYHGMSDPNAGWDGRSIRAEKFQWNSDGSPWFPTPTALGVQLPDSA